MPPLIILAGPTATGKSELGLELAEHFKTEIISADSMQVYKYFDIGTAKPIHEIRQRIPHHLIDFLEPEEEFNAFQFKRLAEERIKVIMAQGKIPIVVGGTGFYLKTLLEGFQCAVMVSQKIRQRIKKQIAEKGPESVYQELAAVDPNYATKISPTDPLRIERAYSVYQETGKPFSQHHADENRTGRDFEYYFFVLHGDRSHLYNKIELRIDKMLDKGWVEEVKALLKRGFSKQLRPFQSIGYSQIANYLDGHLSLEQAVSEIKKESRHYAKRQITWFKNTPNTIPISLTPKEPSPMIRKKILSFLRNSTMILWVSLLILFSSGSTKAHASSTYKKGVELYIKENYSKAETLMKEVVKSRKQTKYHGRAQFILGNIYQHEKNFYDAVKSFQKALKALPEIKDYVRYHLAQTFFHQGKDSESIEEVNSLLQNYRSFPYIIEAEILRAKALVRIGKHDRAIKYLKMVETQYLGKQLSSVRLEASFAKSLLVLGQIQEQLNQKKAAYSTYQKLYIYFPDFNDALNTESRLKVLKNQFLSEVPKISLEESLQRIQSLLRQANYDPVILEIQTLEKSNSLSGQYYIYWARALQATGQRDKAHHIWKKFLKRFPHHPQQQKVQVKLARNLWNLDRDEDAIKEFEKAIYIDPDSDWAILAHYLLGRIHETNKNTDSSLKKYQTLKDSFGNSDYGQEAIWRIGWIAYLESDYSKAIKIFNDNFSRFPNGPVAEYNLYWLAKSFEKKNLNEKAFQTYQKLSHQFPYTFYGVKASSKLKHPHHTEFEDHGKNRHVFRVALNKNSSHYLKTPALNTRAKQRLKRVRKFISMGFHDYAKHELLRLQSQIKKNLSGTLWMARLYNQVEGYKEAYRLLELYHKYKTKRRKKDLPLVFWRFYYPLAFEEHISFQTRAFDLDPLIVNSIIRQESLFDSFSLSPTGARGLMQIMPDTGRELFGNHSNRDLKLDDLYQPELNVRLGVKYLSQLKRRYRENWVHVFICYNAGPETLKKWIKRFKNITDSDVFIEMIPYPETRRYVKHIFRNWGIYQLLYASKT